MMAVSTENLVTPQPDLTIEAGVRAYLVTTPFVSEEIVALTGGTANYVYRLTLSQPYDGRRTLIFKHARPYVRSSSHIALHLERQMYEVEALRRVKAMLSTNSLVTVPAVHLFDKDEHVVVMDDCGEDALSTKDFLQVSNPSIELARKIGTALGDFLGNLHNWGRATADLRAFFWGHEAARKLKAMITYGWVIPTLTGEMKPSKLKDPPFEVEDKDLEVLKTLSQEMSKAIMEEKDSFVMGDFWPGNIMVTLNADGDLKGIYVLDWELSKTGLISIDLGQFCAEIYLLQKCRVQCTETAPALLEEFLRAYKERAHPDEEICRRAVIHLGNHLTILTPRVEWGGNELTQDMVREGVQLMVEGYRAKTRKDLVRTLFGPLLP